MLFFTLNTKVCRPYKYNIQPKLSNTTPKQSLMSLTNGEMFYFIVICIDLVKCEPKHLHSIFSKISKKLQMLHWLHASCQNGISVITGNYF